MINYSLDTSGEQAIIYDFKNQTDTIKNNVNQGKYDMPVKLLSNLTLIVNYDFATIFNAGYGRQFRYFFEALSPKGQDTVISYFREADVVCMEKISDYDARIQKVTSNNSLAYGYDFIHTKFSKISSSTR